MKGRKGTLRLKIGIGTLACVIVAATFGASSASAAEGDTFFLLSKKNTFVSFAVRAGSDEATRTLYYAKKIPCHDTRKPFTAMGYLMQQRPAPIVDGAFYVAWSPLEAGFGGLKGTVDGDTATGTLNLRSLAHVKNSRRPECSTGGREWTAQSVSEERWNTVREKKFGSYADPPTPPAGAAGA